MEKLKIERELDKSVEKMAIIINAISLANESVSRVSSMLGEIQGDVQEQQDSLKNVQSNVVEDLVSQIKVILSEEYVQKITVLEEENEKLKNSCKKTVDFEKIMTSKYESKYLEHKVLGEVIRKAIRESIPDIKKELGVVWYENSYWRNTERI